MGRLVRPIPFAGMPSQVMSPFGSSWGGLGMPHIPFFRSHPNYYHLGGDGSGEADAEVVAAAPGRIVKANSSGEGWGYHIGINHNVDGFRFGFLYEHLQNDPELEARLAGGEVVDVEPGQPIGHLHDLQGFQKEDNHLHLCGTYGEIIMGDRKEIVEDGRIPSADGAAHLDMIRTGSREYFNAMYQGLYRP